MTIVLRAQLCLCLCIIFVLTQLAILHFPFLICTLNRTENVEPAMSKLPLDLPKSLNVADLPESVRSNAIKAIVTDEIYDPWQGKTVSTSKTLTSAAKYASAGMAAAAGVASTISSKLDTPDDEDVEAIVEDETLSEKDKTNKIYKLFFAASSDGDLDTVRDILGGKAKDFIDIDGTDDSGSTALIYASCFGHEDIVVELLRYGADVDKPDQSEWTPLMWAINNSHLDVVERLLENDASVTKKTSTGRSALDFVTPFSEIYTYMASLGYINSNQPSDFYNDGLMSNKGFGGEEPDQLLMESAYNLDVDMTHLKLDDDDDIPGLGTGLDDLDGEQEFLWDRCLPDQMFVFAESDIPRILEVGITQMEPKRSPTQKPIPANLLFLCARYAHNYGSPEILENLLSPAFTRIRNVIMAKREDIAFLSFWLSNCTLLLYYMRKDVNLLPATVEYQEKLSELITDITVLISQDAERRLELVLNSSILDYQTIPGLDEIHYQSEWRIFRSSKKPKSHKEEMEEIYRPPTPKKKMLPSPRNVTSILSSILFVTDLYEVHPIIVQQLMSQIFYWLGSVLFNRIISNRKYLARSRAMQIRLNVSAIEDWARINNRKPDEITDEFHRGGDVKYPSLSDLCRKHFTPLIEILQWLQCFTAIGNDLANVTATLQQLTALNAKQLLHVANKYRAEVGEKGLSKAYKAYLSQLTLYGTKENNYSSQITKCTIHNVLDSESRKPEESVKEPVIKDDVPKMISREPENAGESTPKTEPEPVQEKEKTPAELADSIAPVAPSSSVVAPIHHSDDEDDDGNELYLNASIVLPFVIPTLTEMIVTWGAGLGGTHKKRAKKYEPSLPTEFLDKLDLAGEPNQPSAGLSVNPIFGGNLAMPQPSVHRTWGEDMATEELEREEYGSVW